MNSHRSICAALIVVCWVAWPAAAAARLVVDHVAIHGTPGVTTRVLATRMHLYPGDSVDFAVLKAAEQRLIESDLFRSVHVFIELPTEEAVRRMYLDDKTYPVEVVVEAVGKLSWFAFPTASFGSGDWAGGIAYANQNLFGRDVHVLAAGQIGDRAHVLAIQALGGGQNVVVQTYGTEAQREIMVRVPHTGRESGTELLQTAHQILFGNQVLAEHAQDMRSIGRAALAHRVAVFAQLERHVRRRALLLAAVLRIIRTIQVKVFRSKLEQELRRHVGSVAADGDKTIQPPTFVMLQRACRGVDNFDSFVSFGRVVERVSFVGGTEDCPS